MLSIIVAMSQNGVIGKNNQLPWHLSEDLKRFKTLTMGQAIIMGRKTFESIGKPLPGRTNIVITRNKKYTAQGVILVSSLKEALEKVPTNTEAFVIGGAEIYKEALPHAQTIYLTRIEKEVEGDTFFPVPHLENDFKAADTSAIFLSQKEHFSYCFITLKRKEQK
ncbi:MAG: hypothetical protein A2048_00115 [Deltaproteobacteria bacterium GWA2_45_12]|nr:MAG: hypothetical protein A2048_00115 [Deltaproteobacteria bacterium GWA2_45_12]